MEDGYSSSGSEHTLFDGNQSPVIPPPPASPVAANVSSPKTKDTVKKARNSNKGAKLTPWVSELQLDEVLFKMALILKPYKPVKGMVDYVPLLQFILYLKCHNFVLQA